MRQLDRTGDNYISRMQKISRLLSVCVSSSQATITLIQNQFFSPEIVKNVSQKKDRRVVTNAQVESNQSTTPGIFDCPDIGGFSDERVYYRLSFVR